MDDTKKGLTHAVLGAALFAALSSCGPSPADHPAGATPYTSDEKARIARQAARIEESAPACDMRWSETEIAGRKATGLITDMSVTARGLTITLDAARLARRPEGSLESLVEAADCAIAGPSGHLNRIIVQAKGSGATIATYNASELMSMRTRLQD